MATATSPAPLVEPRLTTVREPQPTLIESSDGGFFRISLDAYRWMGEAGILKRSDRVVLLDGLLVKKMSKGPRHVMVTHLAMERLYRLLPTGYHPRSEAPVELPAGPDGDNAPEPDLSVVRGVIDDYETRHPGPDDVLLVVEVADSSLADDRRGLRRYAWAGIPVVWIVNLRAGTVEVYTNPSGPSEDPGYAAKATRTKGESLELRLDDQTITGLAVADFFGQNQPGDVGESTEKS